MPEDQGQDSVEVPASPRLSIVVVIYDMAAEAERTLYSLSAAYQRGVMAADYEVIVVENGSSEPLEPEVLRSLDGDFSYIHLENAPPSPARAVNVGASHARGISLGIMVDGARLLSPGLVAQALRALEAFEEPLVGTLGFHLGAGGSLASKAEDQRLLAEIAWPEDGYRLFDVASLGGSSRGGWLAPPAECNAVFLKRELFDRLGGFDEAFDLPGGGLVNHDFWGRGLDMASVEGICLLGEGTFHQHHGGISTNSAPEEADHVWRRYVEQYEQIRGRPWTAPRRPLTLFGQVSAESAEWLAFSAELATSRRERKAEPLTASSLAAANRLGIRVAGLEKDLESRSLWHAEQQRELEAQRRLLRQLEEQLGERTRWLQIQAETLETAMERLGALEAKGD